MAEIGRRILIAVDESNESAYALTWCLKNIVCDPNSEDTLLLLHAKPHPATNTAMDTTGYIFSSEVISSMENHGNQVARSVIDKCKGLCKNLYENVKVEVMVESGDPRDVICDVSEKLKVDLLVIGSHGYGAIKRAFLGSVSNHCAQKVKCPVLIVKKPKPEGDDH